MERARRLDSGNSTFLSLSVSSPLPASPSSFPTPVHHLRTASGPPSLEPPRLRSGIAFPHVTLRGLNRRYLLDQRSSRQRRRVIRKGMRFPSERVEESICETTKCNKCWDTEVFRGKREMASHNEKRIYRLCIYFDVV